MDLLGTRRPVDGDQLARGKAMPNDDWSGDRRREDRITPAEIIRLSAEITAAHVANNPVPVNDLPQLIANVHGALSHLSEPEPQQEEKAVPIVSPRASVKPDYLICLECGKKQKMLRQHLLAHHGLTQDDYREKYGLPKSYPMVAQTVRDAYRERALRLGLGGKMLQARNAKRGREGKPPVRQVGGTG